MDSLPPVDKAVSAVWKATGRRKNARTIYHTIYSAGALFGLIRQTDRVGYRKRQDNAVAFGFHADRFHNSGHDLLLLLALDHEENNLLFRLYLDAEKLLNLDVYKRQGRA